MSNYAKYKDLGDGNKPVENFNSKSSDKPRPKFKVYEIQSQEDKNKLIQHNKLCVVDICAEWCQPCKQIADRYSELASKYSNPGNCVLVKENVDSKFSTGIKGVPTFQFFKEGKLVETIVGGDIKEVQKTIENLLSV